ncbi:MAG: ornithine cyclodeaminase, partial [Muribaculum sp.]|nr:ornithine cyclodeaminase [Muribaculum sp.]
LALSTLRSSNASVYSFIGLGAMARATLDCLIATNPDSVLNIRLMRYKDQAERIAAEYASHPNVRFTIVDTVEAFADGSDVIVSCITDADGLVVDDTSMFKPGVLVVPVHTRGFQNCDTIFDRVVADDRAHVEGFRYFNDFRDFSQLEDVLKGNRPGRTSDTERILAYNIGLGLHDVLFATKILEIIQ